MLLFFNFCYNGFGAYNYMNIVRALWTFNITVQTVLCLNKYVFTVRATSVIIRHFYCGFFHNETLTFLVLDFVSII